MTKRVAFCMTFPTLIIYRICLCTTVGGALFEAFDLHYNLRYPKVMTFYITLQLNILYTSGGIMFLVCG